MASSKLPGLNGLRGIAASLVLIGHVYQITGIYGVAGAEAIFKSHEVGTDMVNLFFVISGFIITYVLLKEQQHTRTISLKNFYIKRALRIWPLYFFLFFIVFLVSRNTAVYDLHGKMNEGSVVIFSFFLINMNSFIGYPLSVLPHYWSLSVEEQFYIFWPILFKKANPIWIAVIVLILFFLLRNSTAFTASMHPDIKWWGNLNEVMMLSKFGSMAIGALGALLLNKITGLGKYIFRKGVQAACWGLFFFSIVHKFYIPYVHYEAMALLYLYIILAVTVNPCPLISLENRFFDRIGAISYGIYMYHVPLIPVLIYLLQKFNLWDQFSSFDQLPMVLLTLVSTYLLAYLSFRYFEQPVLKLKPNAKHKNKEQLLTQTYSI